MYRIKNDGTVSVYYNQTPIMENISVYSNTTSKKINTQLESVNESENKVMLRYSNKEERFFAEVSFVIAENGFSIDINAKLKPMYLMPEINSFDEDAGVVICFDVDTSKGFAAGYMESRWWRYVDFNRIPEKTQGLICNFEDVHICYTPQCIKEFKSQLRENEEKHIELYIGSECNGFTNAAGTVLTVTAAQNPYEAAAENARFSAENNLFVTPLKSYKDYPDFLQGFGWCTWNAFYHDVTAEKIEQKLIEFKEKGIMPKWIIIDDGWNETNDWKIRDFKADNKKFPDGLFSFIKRIKKEYGIKYVGIWHSLMAYWWGVDEESIAFKETKHLMTKTNAGYIIPDFREVEKVQGFYEYWHNYLKEQGIDFLKVDMQTETGLFVRDNFSVVEASRNAHDALDESVRRNFNDRLINCMGMGMEATCSRKYSSLIRSSDDFYPDKEGSFRKHMIQNIYNGVFFDELYYCDFDMWWTNQKASVQSGVLRAISGGPVYISDKVGDTNENALKPIMDSSGFIPRCDSAAMPVLENFYNPKEIIKVMNTYKGTNLLAAFNVSEDTHTTLITQYDLKTVEDCSYLAYLYFEKRFVLFDKDSKIELSIAPGECEIINFYKITDGFIMLGDTSKYISSAFNVQRRDVKSLI